MNDENVNLDNVNPHFINLEKFGLTGNPDLTFNTHTPHWNVCPSCGACTACGRSATPVYYGPTWTTMFSQLAVMSGYIGKITFIDFIPKEYHFDAGIPAA